MQALLKHKVLIGGVLAIFLVLVIAGGYLVLSKSKNQTNTSQIIDNSAQQNVQTISAKDLGFVATVRSDKQAVKFKINNAKDIKHIDYQIVYNYELDGQELENGLLGEMNIAADGITETDFREFGTCSHGVCRYDKNVSNVRIILKVEKKDGKIYSDEEKVSL